MLEPWIFKRTDQDLGEILLRSSNVENDDENHHELLRYFEMQHEEYLYSSEKNLDEHFEKELNSWWTIM